MSVQLLIILYILFRVKHYVCDFLLQNGWMALKKGVPGKEGYVPLLVHSATHAVGTTVIALYFAPSLWWLGIVDLVIHSLIDRVKGLITHKKGWKPSDVTFWWVLGLDQEAHNFTHLAYIIVIVMAAGGITL